MITEQEIKTAFKKWESCVDLESLALQLLKERDEALAKADAYREIAKGYHMDEIQHDFPEGCCYQCIDSKAQKIIAGRGAEK